ncbi:MAG: hypothetical protein EA403_08930 [Spirochaetaceae bacterium]|nr:MAG: hypothetical protein EA403_08930 [Spirochaetaceae bacterium]
MPRPESDETTSDTPDASDDDAPPDESEPESDSPDGDATNQDDPMVEEPSDDEAEGDDEPVLESLYVIVNSDGSVSYTQEGLIAGGQNAESFQVQGDGSIDIVGSGERRAYARGFTGSVYRVLIDNARIVSTAGQSARGWAVIVHGGLNAEGNLEGYAVQIDPGLNNSFAIRRWVDGREQSAQWVSLAESFGINLMEPMDLVIDMNHDRLTLVVNDTLVYDAVTLEQPGRTEGFIGLRAWASTNVEIDALRVTQ